MNLYELTGNYLELSKMIEEGGCDNQTLLDTLESIKDATEVKVENTAYVIETAKANREVLGNTIKRLQAKYEALGGNIESTEKFLFGQLEMMGISNMKAGLFVIKKHINPPVVSILDENKIAKKYKIKVPATYKISKTAIASDLKANIKVRGAVLQNSFRWSIK